MAIKEKAEELANEIVESNEFKEMKLAEQKVMNDDEASDLIEDFESAQKRVQMAQRNGKSIDQDQQRKIQNLQAKMQNNNIIKEFIQAQQDFNEVMKEVNEVISATIEESDSGQIIT